MLAARDQSDHRLGLGEAAEVLEVAVLAVHMLDVAVADGNRGGGQDGDAVGFHLRHQRLASTGVFRLGDVAHGQWQSLVDQCSEGLAAGSTGCFASSV
ncbi:hypothetical protein D9M71_174490 [compost metagenome]